MTRLIVALCFVLTFAGSVGWIAYAQQNAPQFTGRSDVMDAKDISAGRRSFEPGARTFWHSHDNGQLLLVEQGRARMQKKGEAIKDLGAGGTDYTAPGVVHWHGAAPNERLVQVNIGFGGQTKWAEQVTDQEYAGRK
jgi:quercetin dioxygenase-like cupin family protein